MITARFLLAFSLSLGSPAVERDEPDLIVLADGKEIECRVLYEDEAKVIYRSKRKDREVARSEVSSIQSVERSLRSFLERFEQVDRSSVAALTDLALFAESSFLPAEAHDMWIRIIVGPDPDNEQAWTKLGGVKGRKGWKLKVRGRFYELEDLRERVSDWKHALELPTAHLLIKTDADPQRALDVAIDVERVYLAFYDLMAPHLGLYYAWEETPEIHIFSDPKDAPSPPTPEHTSWFAMGENRLYVLADTDRNQAIAEFIDLLLFNSLRRTLDTRRGSIAPWAREGLRQAFAAGTTKAPGEVTFDLATPIEAYFRFQVEDEDTLKLKRILSAGFGSFESGTDALRYTAQAYTLTHFLAYGKDGAYQPGLARFLLSSFEGQSSATHLKKILGVDLDDLEQQWLEYVQGRAGGKALKTPGGR
jgi:hypothetical protein